MPRRIVTGSWNSKKFNKSLFCKSSILPGTGCEYLMAVASRKNRRSKLKANPSLVWENWLKRRFESVQWSSILSENFPDSLSTHSPWAFLRYCYLNKNLISHKWIYKSLRTNLFSLTLSTCPPKVQVITGSGSPITSASILSGEPTLIFFFCKFLRSIFGATVE